MLTGTEVLQRNEYLHKTGAVAETDNPYAASSAATACAERSAEYLAVTESTREGHAPGSADHYARKCGHLWAELYHAHQEIVRLELVAAGRNA